MTKFMTAALALIISSATLADPEITINTKQLYAGAGLNYNRIDSSTLGGPDGDATGLQVFAGYKMGNRNGFDIASEIGLIQSDEWYNGSREDADGLWVSAVANKGLPEIDSRLSAIARLGYGIGGDDGLFMGFGAQFKLHPQAFIRGEYLNKDLSQSFQINAAYQF